MNFTNKVLQIIYKQFLENRFLNRWFVLAIDLSIVVVSTSISYFITLQAYKATPELAHPSLLTCIVVSVVASLFFFMLLRTYVGIIRYSTMHEFVRSLNALILTCAAIFAYMAIFYWPSIKLFVLYGSSFLLYSLLGLFFFRVVVIYTYRYMQRLYSGRVTEVFLWGVNESTVSMSQSFNSNQSNYKVKGFIDDGRCTKLRKNTSLTILSKNDKALRSKVRNVLFLSEKHLRENQDFAERLVKQGIALYVMQDVNIENLEELKRASHSIRPILIEDLLGRDEIEISFASILENVKGRTILVTGAAGSIGSEIVRQLAHFSPKLVICFDQAETPMHTLSLELAKTKLNYEIIVGDIRGLQKLSKVFEFYKPEIIYHAAAYKHVPLMEKDPCEAIITNVLGTKHLVDLSVQHNVEMFVMVSTDKAVNPTNVMGASKRIAEIYVQTCALTPEIKKVAKTKFVTTRFGNVLGSNGSVIPLFKKQIASGGPLTVTHKEITRFFMTIPEACRLVLEASFIGHSGYIYVFDMGEPVKIYDLAVRMIELAGLVPEKDIKIEFSGLRPGEKLYEELFNDSEVTEKTSHEKINIAKVRQYKLEEILPQLENMISLARENQVIDVVRCMKQLVPEYISQNSEFELQDQLQQNEVVVK